MFPSMWKNLPGQTNKNTITDRAGTIIIVAIQFFWGAQKKKTRCVCERLMPPKHPSFEKHDHDI